MRPLLRDYVEMLLLTGMRHGTEAMGICWRHLEWHTDKGVRYLRIWWLIAKHRAVEVLKRLHARQRDICALSFETTFAYATFELLRGGTDIHTLSKQMGNSAAMIERHYSKLTATMAADRLA
jgi:integrase